MAVRQVLVRVGGVLVALHHLRRAKAVHRRAVHPVVLRVRRRALRLQRLDVLDAAIARQLGAVAWAGVRHLECVESRALQGQAVLVTSCAHTALA